MMVTDSLSAAVSIHRLLPAVGLFLMTGILHIPGALLSAEPAATAPATSQPVNLVTNGDFSRMDPSTDLPLGWTTRHRPNVACEIVGDPPVRIVRMTGDEKLMASYGVDLLSEPIPVKANTQYRLTFDVRTQAPRQIVFVKGYATLTLSENGQPVTRDEPVYQMKKEVLTPAPDWLEQSMIFDIRPVQSFSTFQHEIKYLRILLWAYWPQGVCWYRNIRFVEIGEIPANDRLHDQAVTHTGQAPKRLDTPVDDSDKPDDEIQTLSTQAIHAFQLDDFAAAWKFAQRLLAKEPNQAEHHLLAARALAELRDWPSVMEQAQWLTDRALKPYQKDWGTVLSAQAMWNLGQREQAIQKLNQAIGQCQSEQARRQAQSLLNQYQGGPALDPDARR